MTATDPFTVEFGGAPRTDVHLLEIQHEAPMFIDHLVGLGGLRARLSDEHVTAVQFVPQAEGELAFRITAEEPVPEVGKLAARRTIAKLKTPVPYRGVVQHLRHWSSARLADISHRMTQPDSVGDHVAHAIVMPVIALSAAVPALPRALAATGMVGAVAAAAAWASTQTLQTGVVFVPVACDPSRTYINGELYKNLAEVRVRVRAGRIWGYATL